MVELRLLGSVELLDDSGAVADLQAQQQALLALLAWRSPIGIAKRELIDEFWPYDPPARHNNALQARISRLRKVFAACEPHQPHPRLCTYATGYRLIIDDTECDAQRFRSLRRQALSAMDRPDHALRVLDSALALWRGPALYSASLGPAGGAIAATLNELRMLATSEAMGLRLMLGRHREIVTDLQELVGRHPYDETFHDQLIVALYRCGRQEQALAVYSRLRHNLAQGLGIEPTAALQRRMHDILNNAPLHGGAYDWASDGTARADAS